MPSKTFSEIHKENRLATICIVNKCAVFALVVDIRSNYNKTMYCICIAFVLYSLLLYLL